MKEGVNPVVRNFSLFIENREWSHKLHEKGYTIFDIGDPSNANIKSGISEFYKMEKEIIFGVYE